MLIASAVRTRLEKSAADNGFDLEVPSPKGWLAFGSSQAPLRIWLTASWDGPLVAALSQANVLQALAGHGTPSLGPVPADACGAQVVTDFAALHYLLRRAFQLSRTLPDELLRAFENQTAEMGRATEAERLVIQRVGQDLYRQGLLEYWDGRCAITGLAVPELLRASHAKPWKDATDRDRLDVYNGLLLVAHLDAAFDQGLIAVDDDGSVIVAPTLPPDAARILGLDKPLCVVGLHPRHAPYLAWHRVHVFRRMANLEPREGDRGQGLPTSGVADVAAR